MWTVAVNVVQVFAHSGVQSVSRLVANHVIVVVVVNCFSALRVTTSLTKQKICHASIYFVLFFSVSVPPRVISYSNHNILKGSFSYMLVSNLSSTSFRRSQVVNQNIFFNKHLILLSSPSSRYSKSFLAVSRSFSASNVNIVCADILHKKPASLC